jgi:hypothetical protein
MDEWIDEWMNAHESLCQVLRMVFTSVDWLWSFDLVNLPAGS